MASEWYPEPRAPETSPNDNLLPYAREIVNKSGTKTSYLTCGYGMVDEGDDVLLAVRSLHNERIVNP